MRPDRPLRVRAVWDVGPWNTTTTTGTRRACASPGETCRGLPQSQAADQSGYNGGHDQFGREVVNPAGIDLADGTFWDALGLKDNAWVEVDYLWTGDSPLGTVRVRDRVDLHGAPDATAPVVGLAAEGAAVPLQCATGAWLRVGAGEFLAASAVPPQQWPRHLPGCSG